MTQLSSNEADIQLALLSIVSGQLDANRRAAAIYRVPESTLRDRRAGKTARRDCQPTDLMIPIIHISQTHWPKAFRSF